MGNISLGTGACYESPPLHINAPRGFPSASRSNSPLSIFAQPFPGAGFTRPGNDPAYTRGTPFLEKEEL